MRTAKKKKVIKETKRKEKPEGDPRVLHQMRREGIFKPIPYR